MIALGVNSTVRVWNIKDKMVVYEAPAKLTNESPVSDIIWRDNTMSWRKAGDIRFWQPLSNEKPLPPSVSIPRILTMDWNKATNRFVLFAGTYGIPNTVARLIIYDPVAAKITAEAPDRKSVV